MPARSARISELPVYLALRELPSVSAIVDSRYVLLLVAKTATFAVASGLDRRSVIPGSRRARAPHRCVAR